MKSCGVGGQAVIEGVMMKNKSEYAVAVRTPENEIVIEKQTYHSLSEKIKLFRLPVIRGVLAFVESLVVGTKTLTYSASFFDEEEDISAKDKKKSKNQKQEKKERKVSNSNNKKSEDEKTKEKDSDGIFMFFTIAFSILFAVGLFILLPFWLSDLLSSKIESSTILAVLEGVIRLSIFAIYLIAISRMKDIQRVFMYHGAEHKTINCIEQGLKLTVDNVRKQSREHKRCGTSFMLIVIIVSSIFFIFISIDNIWIKTVVRLLLVPVIAGISYEFIRLAGRSESRFVTLLSRPGMWMQGLTTREPSDDMIEVAIQSVEAVFDWKKFQEEAEDEKYTKAEQYQQADEVIAKAISTVALTDEFGAEDEEEDELLRALDKYFVPKSK